MQQFNCCSINVDVLHYRKIDEIKNEIYNELHIFLQELLNRDQGIGAYWKHIKALLIKYIKHIKYQIYIKKIHFHKIKGLRHFRHFRNIKYLIST